MDKKAYIDDILWNGLFQLHDLLDCVTTKVELSCVQFQNWKFQMILYTIRSKQPRLPIRPTSTRAPTPLIPCNRSLLKPRAHVPTPGRVPEYHTVQWWPLAAITTAFLFVTGAEKAGGHAWKIGSPVDAHVAAAITALDTRFVAGSARAARAAFHPQMDFHYVSPFRLWRRVFFLGEKRSGNDVRCWNERFSCFIYNV